MPALEETASFSRKMTFSVIPRKTAVSTSQPPQLLTHPVKTDGGTLWGTASQTPGLWSLEAQNLPLSFRPEHIPPCCQFFPLEGCCVCHGWPRDSVLPPTASANREQAMQVGLKTPLDRDPRRPKYPFCGCLRERICFLCLLAVLGVYLASTIATSSMDSAIL